MLSKSFKIVLTIVSIAIIGFISVIFFASIGNKPISKERLTQESLVPLNSIIADAVTVYATAPYHRFSNEEIHKYFSNEIAGEILGNYEQRDDPYEERAIEFEEQPYPEVNVVNIQFDNGEYSVKLQFGEVYYNYRLMITPNRIITRIIDGGITFE